MDGILGKKLGMTQVVGETGRGEPITVIQAGPCTVTQVRTVVKEGYRAVQLGFDEARRLNKPRQGHLKGLGAFRYLREFAWQQDPPYQVGQRLDADIFAPGDLVDVTGTSKGRGFAGVVKRHHFAGGPKTHGQSDRHRAPGSIGSGTTPGRVFKGLRMAGHMGAARATVRNLQVLESNPATG